MSYPLKATKTLLTVVYIAVLLLYSYARGVSSRLKRGEAADERAAEIRHLREHGYVVLEGYYSEEKIQRMLRTAGDNMDDGYGDYDHIDGEAYFRRPAPDQEVDGGVFRVYGAQGVNADYLGFRDDPVLVNIVERAFHIPITCNASVLQKNQPLGSETAGFHVDTYAPKQFKAFLFLTDVPNEECGPLAIIPGSHRWFLRQMTNYLVQGLKGLQDTGAFDRLSDAELRSARLFTVKRGTVVIAIQQAIHRGWPLRIGPRFVLVNYYIERLSEKTPGYHINKRLGYKYDFADLPSRTSRTAGQLEEQPQ